MISIQQCRAARALLGWTQQELADACGLSKTAINNFEKGTSDIKLDSLKAIQLAFEVSNIEFLNDNGLRVRSIKTKIISNLSELVSLIDGALKSETNTLYISNFYRDQNDANWQELMQYKERIKIAYKEGEEPFLSEKDNSCWIPKTVSEQMHQTFIFDNKIAIILGSSKKIILVENKESYDEERERFNRAWESNAKNKISLNIKKTA